MKCSNLLPLAFDTTALSPHYLKLVLLYIYKRVGLFIIACLLGQNIRSVPGPKPQTKPNPDLAVDTEVLQAESKHLKPVTD